jgi:hypothetical protein
MDRGKTVYPPPPLGSGGIKIQVHLYQLLKVALNTISLLSDMSQIKVLRAIIDLFKLFLQTRNVDWFLRSSRETVSKFLFTNIFTGNFKVKMYRAAQEINPINTYQGL